jgi:AraC-like DNA-binding protein
MRCLELQIPALPQFITIGRSIWKPGDQHFARSFNVYDMIYVSKGTLYMKEQEQSYAVSEGHLLVLEPNATHYGYLPCEEYTEVTWIHFVHTPPRRELIHEHIHWTLPLDTGTTKDLAPKEQHIYLPKFAAVRAGTIVPFLDRMLELHHTFSIRHALQLQAEFIGLLAELQSYIRRLDSSRSRMLSDDIIDYLQQRISLPFNGKQMESDFHFHFDYLARCLKKHTGLSPIQYLHTLQIEKAKSLLQNTSLTVSEIGGQLGMENPSYFIKLFRKQTGLTPGQYRTAAADQVATEA